MDKTNSQQKKKVVMNYVYAILIGILVIACAVTITLVSADNSNGRADVGDDGVDVSTTTYVGPMQNATIAKDYSGTELQYNDTLKQWEIHKAIDFIATDNLNVYAVADGTVSNVYTNWQRGWSWKNARRRFSSTGQGATPGRNPRATGWRCPLPG